MILELEKQKRKIRRRRRTITISNLGLITRATSTIDKKRRAAAISRKRRIWRRE